MTPTDDSAHPTDVITANSRSFSTAARFLPRSIRGDVVKLYAWCRACDDAVDDAETPDEALVQWQLLRDDVDRIGRDETVLHPASSLLKELIEEGGIPSDQAIDLLRAMQIDLEIDRGETSIRSEADLLRYCYHAAGVVGLMMCRVMGVENRAADSHAKSLGIAMQLTNIARDVREDAERGRCYLPAPENNTDKNNKDKNNKAENSKAVAELLDLADRHYQHALAGMIFLPRRCRPAILMAAALYREIGNEIRRHDCHVMDGRIIVPRFRFAWTAARAGLFSTAAILPPVRQSTTPVSLFPSPTSTQDHVMSSVPKFDSLARANAYLGVSLTCFMATALFAMVYINPKETSYTWLPLVYAGVSLVIAVITHFQSTRYLALLQRSTVSTHEER